MEHVVSRLNGTVRLEQILSGLTSKMFRKCRCHTRLRRGSGRGKGWGLRISAQLRERIHSSQRILQAPLASEDATQGRDYDLSVAETKPRVAASFSLAWFARLPTPNVHALAVGWLSGAGLPFAAGSRATNHSRNDSR